MPLVLCVSRTQCEIATDTPKKGKLEHTSSQDSNSLLVQCFSFPFFVWYELYHVFTGKHFSFVDEFVT